MHLPTIKQIEIFVHVVEKGSFRGSAEALGITPVSISGHISELETRLNCKLFDRKPGHNVILTEKGEEAYSKSKKILQDMNDLVYSFSENPDDYHIAISLHPFISRYLLNDIKAFEAQHQEITLDVQLVASSPSELVEKVKQGRLDMAYLMTVEGEDTEETEYVAEEPMAIYVAHNHPLASKTAVTQADLEAYLVVHLSQGNHLRHLAEHVLSNAGVEVTNVLLETDEYALILDTVAHSEGFVCMFEYNAQDVNLSKKLVKLNLGFTLPSIQVRCFCKRMSSGDVLLKQLKLDLNKRYRQMRARSSVE